MQDKHYWRQNMFWLRRCDLTRLRYNIKGWNIGKQLLKSASGDVRVFWWCRTSITDVRIGFGYVVVTSQYSDIISRAEQSASLIPALTSKTFVLHHQSSLTSITDVRIGFGDEVVTLHYLGIMSRAETSAWLKGTLTSESFVLHH